MNRSFSYKMYCWEDIFQELSTTVCKQHKNLSFASGIGSRCSCSSIQYFQSPWRADVGKFVSEVAPARASSSGTSAPKLWAERYAKSNRLEQIKRLQPFHQSCILQCIDFCSLLIKAIISHQTSIICQQTFIVIFIQALYKPIIVSSSK